MFASDSPAANDAASRSGRLSTASEAAIRPYITVVAPSESSSTGRRPKRSDNPPSTGEPMNWPSG
jgi:hypothetical protein